MGDPMRVRRSEVTRGTANVFMDLGFPGAAERQTRLRLAYAVNRLLDGRKFSRTEAARVLAMRQSEVSRLRNFKLAEFSRERLLTILTALDQDITIIIRHKPRSRKTARISVVVV